MITPQLSQGFFYDGKISYPLNLDHCEHKAIPAMPNLKWYEGSLFLTYLSINFIHEQSNKAYLEKQYAGSLPEVSLNPGSPQVGIG